MTGPASTFGLDGWLEKGLFVGITLVAALVAFAVIRLVTPGIERRAGRSTDPVKWQQRRTAVALLATALRYVVLIAALFTVIAILSGARGMSALGGSAILAVMIGFASQRLLTDVIAGFFILFEGQYGVGDVIQVETSKYTGMVESLGIRTTVIRQADGTRCYVPNGSVVGVRRFTSREAALTLILMTRDPESVEAALRDLQGLAERSQGLVSAPHDLERIEVGDAITAVRVTVEVPAVRLAESEALVTQAIRARLGALLVGDPVVVPVEHAPDSLDRPMDRTSA